MNKVLLNDLKEISLSSSVNWEKIDGKSFLITGATGLIGSILVKSLQLRNKLKNSNIKILRCQRKYCINRAAKK